MEAGAIQTEEWRQQGTTVTAVERQLAAMLRAFREPTADPGAHPPPRASVLNLVIRATGDADQDAALEVLGDLAGRHPSRTLAVVVGPTDAASTLDAFVTGHCHVRSHDGGRACYEVVRLSARGEMTQRLDTVIEPLLLEDLPTFLWWLGDPPATGEPLLDVAQRLIVDAKAFSDPLCGLGVLGDLGDVGLGDLMWSRLAPWRELLAQFFDPLDARTFQRAVDRVEVRCAASPIAGPLLLVGWLAQALGWQVVGVWDGPWQPLRLRGYGRTVTVHVEPAAVASPPDDGLLHVALEARHGAARFVVARADDGLCVTTHAELPDRIPLLRTTVVPADTTAALLRRELDHPRPDPGLHAALAALRRLATGVSR